MWRKGQKHRGREVGERNTHEAPSEIPKILKKFLRAAAVNVL